MPTYPQNSSRSTSASLIALVRAGVEAQVGRQDAAMSKLQLLQRLARPADAFDIGRSIRGQRSHPVIDAVIRADTPAFVLERWQSIEAFGHTSHRTRTIEDDTTGLEVEHISVDARPISELEHQFIWGLLAGLLDLWGSSSVRVCAPQLARTRIEVAPRTRGEPATPTSTRPSADAVGAMVRTDVMRGWTLATTARRLGTSVRSLQRALHADGTTFSGVVQRIRLDAAATMLRQTDLGLTEIAFCTGFSDHAHLTRTCRKVFDLPPSELRALFRRSPR